MKDRIREIVSEIRRSKGDGDISQITESMKLREDIGFDSFDLAEFTVKVESEFGIDIFESGMINTIGEVEKKLSKIDK